MKKLLFTILAIFAWMSGNAQKIDWVKYPSAGSSGRGCGATSDTAGNVYTMAEIDGQLIIQTDTFSNQYGNRDILIVKYDSNGSLVWGKVIGSSAYDWAFELAMDASQNLYASVVIQNATQMNDTIYNAPYDGQIIQFDANGSFKRYISKNTLHILLDARDDAFYLAVDAKVEKRDTSFNLIWSKSVTPGIVNFSRMTSTLCAHSMLKVGKNGRMVITGEESGTGGTATFDTVTIKFSGAAGSNEVCVISMDTSGAAYWSRSLDSLSTQSERTGRVNVDQNGNVYLGAKLGAGYMYFANDTLYNSINPANGYCAIFKFDSLGEAQWARAIYSSYTTELYDFAINTQQELLLCGQVRYPAELAGVSLSTPIAGDRTYVAKLNDQGTFQWVKNDYGGVNGTRRLKAITITSDGRYATTGSYSAGASGIYRIGCFSSGVGSSGMITLTISENPEPVPTAAFDLKFEGGMAYFENLSVNDDNIKWMFGDGQTDQVMRNPSHAYPVPGYYNACVVASNGCGSDTICSTILVEGIEKVSPDHLANSGYHLLKITGGFPFINGTVKFIKNGQSDINPDTVIFRNPGLIQANLKLDQAPLGDWDLVINSGSFNDTLFNAITIELPDTGRIEVQVSGAGKTLVNTIWPYRITLTNRSNRTEIGFPLGISVSPDATIFSMYEELGDSFTQAGIDSIGNFSYVLDTLSGDSVLLGGFLIPSLSPGESKTFRLAMQFPIVGTKTIEAFLGSSYFSQQNLSDMGLRAMSSCNFLPNCISCALDILGFVPGVGCVTGALNMGCAIGNGLRGGPGGSATDIVGSIAGTALSCAGPAGALNNARKAFQIAAGLGDLAGSASGFASGCGVAGGCHFYSKTNWTWPNAASLDPNTKTGPLGLTPENYVSREKSMHYFIHFENINSASAPAREVVIRDTIDVSVFDPASFRFTSFAFGDSTYDLDVQDNMFVTELDLRPAKNIILRVSGMLDSLSHVVTWKYSSFDTTTYDLTMNVNDGFLPPNITRPNGEGYVTYTIALLPQLPHLQQLSNTAHIFFDSNPPIATDVFINTIDTISPVSQVAITPVIINDTTFVITWSGSDVHAGVNVYDIYMSENDGPFMLVFKSTSKTWAKITGTFGNKYEFYSIATDHADNIEAPPVDPSNAPDAVIILNHIPETTDEIAIILSPNPAVKELTIRSSALLKGINVFDAIGAEIYRSKAEINSSHFILQTWNFPSGVYFIEMDFNNKKRYAKFIKSE